MKTQRRSFLKGLLGGLGIFTASKVIPITPENYVKTFEKTSLPPKLTNGSGYYNIVHTGVYQCSGLITITGMCPPNFRPPFV